MRSITHFLINLIAVTLLFLAGLQSGSALASTPTSDFTINGDGSTITHKTTGLTWKRCAEGQLWTGSTCSGAARTYNWNQAMALGTNGWGLPTKDQLLTILETDHASPLINQTIFPNAPDWWFWSASGYGTDQASAWYVGFGYLNDFSGSLKNNANAVRLVQGGQSTGPLAILSELKLTCPTTINASESGKCSVSAIYKDGTSKAVNGYDWTSSDTNSLVLAGVVSDGISIYAKTPASDTVVAITFNYTENGISKSASTTVTVKAARSVLTGLVASCPDTINAGTSATCSATAIYNDGSSKVVNAFWYSTIAATTLGVGRNTGILTAGMPNVDTAVTILAEYTENNISQNYSVSVTVKLAIPVLTDLAAGCSDTSIKAGASFICDATAGYSNGHYSAVRPNWSSSDSAVLSVDSNGKATAGTPKFDTVVTISASYSEGGVSLIGKAIITVKAAPLVLKDLTVTCPDYPMNAGTYASCYATVTYNDGSSKAVNPSWYTTNPTALSIGSNGNLTAGKPYSDTVVTISAIYEENGVSKSVNGTVTVKAAPAKLFNLKATCPNTLNANASSTCSTIASYDDATNKQVTPTWTSSNPNVLSVDGGGKITAGKPSANTAVIISASYTENGVSEFSSVSVTIIVSQVPDNGSILAMPQLSITPTEAAHGTPIKLSFQAVKNATGYRLCIGKNTGNYSLSCFPVNSGDQFVMQDGWDYYVALKAVNGNSESDFSNELHIISQPVASDNTWGALSIGIDYDQEVTTGNLPPTYFLSVNQLRIFRPGDIVHFIANATDVDSSQLFFFWNATGGLLRATNTRYTEVEWKAPQVPGAYVVTGSVGDGDGHVNGAYAILIVQ